MEHEDHPRGSPTTWTTAPTNSSRERPLDSEIGHVRKDWEAKRGDPGVPGAAPPPDSD